MIFLNFIALLIFLPFLAPADTAYHVMDVCAAVPRPAYEKMTLSVEHTESDGSSMQEKFILYGKNADGQMSLALEEATASGNTGRRLLWLEKGAAKTEVTINEPSLKSPKKVSAFDMKKKIFSSEFTFNSFKNRSVEDDEHELLAEKEKITINSKSYRCWKIKSVPITKTVVDYSYRISWVEKETHLPVIVQFYSESKKNGTVLLRTFRVEELAKIRGETGAVYDVWTECSMKNEATGRTSTIHADDFFFDTAIPESIFTSSWIGNKK